MHALGLTVHCINAQSGSTHDRCCLLLPGTANEIYSLVTDNEHSLNAQFVERGHRLDEQTLEWLDLPTLGDRATVLGAVALTYKNETVEVSRSESGQTTGPCSTSLFLLQRCAVCMQVWLISWPGELHCGRLNITQSASLMCSARSCTDSFSFLNCAALFDAEAHSMTVIQGACELPACAVEQFNKGLKISR